MKNPTFTFGEDITNEFVIIDKFVIENDHVAVTFLSKLDIEMHVGDVLHFCPHGIEKKPLSNSG